jgi:8-oxo-dGTP diphosphatase
VAELVDGANIVRAAGGIVWKARPSGRALAVIHRKRQDDWTLPKGKLDDGETFEQAALREVREETGCDARLGAFAGASTYHSKRGPKVVLYWHMTVLRESGLAASSEVDEVAWLAPAEALRRLSRERDRRLLRAVLLEDRCAGAHARGFPRRRDAARASSTVT